MGRYAVSERERLQFTGRCGTCNNTGKVDTKDKTECIFPATNSWGWHLHYCKKECTACQEDKTVYLRVALKKNDGTNGYHTTDTPCTLLGIETKWFDRAPHATISIDGKTYVVYSTDLSIHTVQGEADHRASLRNRMGGVPNASAAMSQWQSIPSDQYSRRSSGVSSRRSSNASTRSRGSGSPRSTGSLSRRGSVRSAASTGSRNDDNTAGAAYIRSRDSRRSSGSLSPREGNRSMQSTQCPACHGRGEVYAYDYDGYRPCPNCGGTDEKISSLSNSRGGSPRTPRQGSTRSGDDDMPEASELVRQNSTSIPSNVPGRSARGHLVRALGRPASKALLRLSS